jgi:hypothetical protein
MAGSHLLRAPKDGVHRVSRSIDVFAFHTPQPLPRPAPGPIEDGNRWDDAEGKFATSWRGLRYPSRLAPDWECWAIWEPSPLLMSHLVVEKVTREHPALRAAAQRLHLHI